MKKNTFESLVLDMNATAALMPDAKYVISDQEIIARIEKISDLTQTDRDGRTLLHNAAAYGRVSVVQHLLSRGVDVNAKDGASFTALHAAVSANDIRTVEVLLQAGADVNAENQFGNSPLMIGNYATKPEIYKTLMAHGADPGQKNHYGVSPMDIFQTAPDILAILTKD